MTTRAVIKHIPILLMFVGHMILILKFGYLISLGVTCVALGISLKCIESML